MITHNKKIRKNLIWIFSALYLYIFLLFYVPNYVFGEFGITLDGGWLDFYLVLRKLSERIVNSFVPICAGVVLFIDAPTHAKSFLGGLILALPTAVYSLPYCYLYALSLGFDSIWGTLISLCFTILGVAATFCQISLAYVIASVAIRIGIWRKIKDELPPSERVINTKEGFKKTIARLDAAVPEWKFEGGMFELDSPSVLAIFSVSCAEFAVKLIIEIVDTVSFLATAGATFNTTEVLSILLSYLVLLAELLIYHELCWLIRKLFNNSAVKDTAEGV